MEVTTSRDGFGTGRGDRGLVRGWVGSASVRRHRSARRTGRGAVDDTWSCAAPVQVRTQAVHGKDGRSSGHGPTLTCACRRRRSRSISRKRIGRDIGVELRVGAAGIRARCPIAQGGKTVTIFGRHSRDKEVRSGTESRRTSMSRRHRIWRVDRSRNRSIAVRN